ncbi:g6850 [Coccomyxa viridis]|uniref:G6850 protein n=1 Tax=Coccomyxa viridis TaxID=1274662 RepID=A0ABP1FWF6_9CHLO
MGLLPRWLGPVEPGQKGESDTDVARLAKLRERALDQEASWLTINSDLVVVGESNRIELVYLREAVTEREADLIGDVLGSLHDQGIAEGGTVAEDPETSFPRADGSRPQVVEVGNVAAGVNQEGIVRTALERRHASYKHAVDEGLNKVLLWRADVRHGSFARAEGPMPAGGDLLIHALKLQLETTSRACALFDSAALWHSTEECALSGPGQAARIGVHLYCNKDVLAIADEDGRALLRASGY